MIITQKDAQFCLCSPGVQLVEVYSKAFHPSARQKQFSQKNFFNNASVCPIAIPMSTNFSFLGSYTENPLNYQRFDLRRTEILRSGQPIVHFDATDECRWYATTLEAMNSQDDIPSILIDNFRNYCALVLDLISMQDGNENSLGQKLENH